jgi:4-amino-4-deoxy-L-arabinose transferase-like glycosyltransferase
VTTRLGTAVDDDRSRWAWLSEPRGTLALLLVWAVGHVVLRLLLSSSLTADDAREAVLAQDLQWVYQARQPPLYNWLVWGVFRLLGPGLLALTLLKYAVLVLAFWLVYLTARRILADLRLAALGAFSFLLVVPISWTIHEALTHSLTVLAACAGTIYALIRLADAPSLRAYAGLGLIVGLGLLSKFTYGLFLVGLALAVLTVGHYRQAVLRPVIVLSALVAVLLVLPFAIWFLGEGHDLAGLYAREVRIDDGDAWAEEASMGLAYVVRMAVSYLAPLAVALAACFPTVYRRVPREPRSSPGGRLLGWLLAWMLLALAATALAGGLSFLKARWLIPVFFLAPLYGLWRLEPHGVPRKGVAAFAILLLAAEAIVVGALIVRVAGASLFARPYPMNEPYDAIASGLARAGFTHGTVVAGFGTLAGNLAVRFPASRILHTEYPDFRPPANETGQCLLAWERHERGRNHAPTVPEEVEHVAAALGVALTGAEHIEVVEAPLRFDPRHVRRVSYLLLPDGAGHCR